MTITVERPGATAFRGRPVTLLGPELRPGDEAPDFVLTANDFSPVTLKDTGAGVRILSVVPSLDTEVCDAQTRRFCAATDALDGVSVVTVSADLPFAQGRWCGAAGLPSARTLSDHRELSFGRAYGVAVAELRVLARAVFVVDADNRLVHVEYTAESGQHPDYDTALEAARAAVRP